MRIGCISDLHIDYNNSVKNYEDNLIKKIKEQNIDLLVVAGDFSSRIDLSLMFLERLKKEVFFPVFSIAGNHDFWHCPTISMKEKIEKFDRESMSLIVGKVGVCGATGWYDGSFSNRGYAEMNLNGKTIQGNWPDLRFIQEACGNAAEFNRQMTYLFNKKIRKDLSFLNKRVDKIVLVSHMLPDKTFLSSLPAHFATNGFFGNDELTQIIKEHKISTVVFGHTHYPRRKMKNGIEYVCAPMGYSFEWNNKNFEERFNEIFQIVEVWG